MNAGSNNVKTRILVLRIRKIALIIAACALSILGILIALYFNLIPGVLLTPPKIDAKYLVASFDSGQNTVDVYQTKEQVCVDTYSTSPADVPHQVCSESSRKISRSDITLRWFTYNGKLEEVTADYPNTTSVHIVIKDGDKVIFDHSESFIENLVDAFDKGMQRLPEPKK